MSKEIDSNDQPEQTEDTEGHVTRRNSRRKNAREDSPADTEGNRARNARDDKPADTEGHISRR